MEIYPAEVVQKAKDNGSYFVDIKSDNNIRSVGDFLMAGCLSPDNWGMYF